MKIISRGELLTREHLLPALSDHFFMSAIFYIDGVNLYALTPASFSSTESHNRLSTVGFAPQCANQKKALKKHHEENCACFPCLCVKSLQRFRNGPLRRKFSRTDMND